MTTTLGPAARASLDKCLNRAVAQNQLFGLTAALVNRKGIQYQAAFGTRSSTSDEPMTEDAVLAIMSMTKAITGAAAMQLVERNKLQLDTPARAVCPELGALKVLRGFDNAGEPILQAPHSDITLRQLLTHTSGLAYTTWNADLLRYVNHTKTPDISTLKKAALRLPLMFEPGSNWEYGIGIDWVGQMVEAVSGQTLGAYFVEHITGPLGMHNTAFTPTPAMLEKMVPIHKRTEDGGLKPLPANVPEHPEFEMGGGGLLSTVTDYSQFVRMIMNDGLHEGARILSVESIAAMTANQIGELRVKPLPTALKMLSNDAEFFPGEPKSWGLTFQISETDCATGRTAGTLMWAGLANSYFWIDRNKDLAGIYLTQVFPFVDDHALAHYYDFETAAYATQDANHEQ